MNAYLCIIIWIFILFIICEMLQYQELKELEKKYYESKEKNRKSLDTIEQLLSKLANVKSDLNQIERQLEIKEQECLEANRSIQHLKRKANK